MQLPAVRGSKRNRTSQDSSPGMRAGATGVLVGWGASTHNKGMRRRIFGVINANFSAVLSGWDIYTSTGRDLQEYSAPVKERT